MKLFFCIYALFSSSLAYAYQANCTTNDGRSFNISVRDKVLTVDNKYHHPYQGRTDKGWYEYANSKYTYKTGSFKGDEFPIEVIKGRGKRASGQCRFR
ncbi:hypothetical protein [Psychrosphaera aestuarii]|uniref:hypothetical protein n=1 Tax=Psychrosphaera aestuarii TaxID=1266052 RepID=UPI001B33DE1E|nr:hypothetical protein [Psychrosphaera aestuarii]